MGINRKTIARGWEKGWMEKLYGYRVPVRKYEKVGLDGGCDTMWRYLMLQKCTLRSQRNGKFCYVYNRFFKSRKKEKEGRKKETRNQWKSLSTGAEVYIRKEVKKWRTRFEIWHVMQILLLLVSSHQHICDTLAGLLSTRVNTTPDWSSWGKFSLIPIQGNHWIETREPQTSLSDFVLCYP